MLLLFNPRVITRLSYQQLVERWKQVKDKYESSK